MTPFQEPVKAAADADYWLAALNAGVEPTALDNARPRPASVTKEGGTKMRSNTAISSGIPCHLCHPERS
jgi:hypothetical protein